MTSPPESIQRLGDEELTHLQAQVQILISAVTERVHYAEARRTNFGNVGGAIFAGGLGLASLAASNRSHVLISIPALVVAILSILCGLFVWLIYFLQTNKYPWTEATYNWKWFYRDALPDASKFTLTLSDTLSPSRSSLSSAKPEYTGQLPPFASRIAEIGDRRQDLWQDIQQLYTLHVDERYKNLHLNQLRWLLKSYVLAVFVLVFLSGSLGLSQIPICGTPQHRLVDSHGVVVGAWHLASQVDSGSSSGRRLLVRMPLTLALYGPALEARDQKGTLIPVTAHFPVGLQGSSSDNVWVTVTVSEDLANSISTLSVRSP